MLGFAIFAVIFVVTLIISIIYLYPKKTKTTTVPGLEPTNKEDGNLPDIGRAGSLHEFLMDLHEQYGPIASFWMGEKLIVSIASPELFKEHLTVFDRPPELFNIFLPILGEQSIQYANGTVGRKRRQAMDQTFSHDQLSLYYDGLQKIANDIETKWLSLVKEEHIPLSQYMFAFSIKAALQSFLGGHFKDDKEVLAFKRDYDVVWAEMEHRLADPELPADNTVRAKAFNESLQRIKDAVMKSIEDRKKISAKSDDYIFLDRMIDFNEDDDLTFCDGIVSLLGGFHTTANVLTWAMYFLASHQDVQDKVHKELKTVLKDEPVNPHNIKKLQYLRQVIDETLRCGVIAPWAARFQDFDSELGGHKIPKNTPVIHALGVVLHDEKIWPLPNKFDPDRFNPENTKARPNLAFSPFGFAGKRICPGYQFAYIEASILLATILLRFKIDLVEGQVVKPVFGLVTHPLDEIWITISKRK
ncbi:cytochrome P450 20A1-like [Gigantopelta aegis]|uniref:cytochrome P450 20A1-like n=1 Tax=Gigantopelta aegis TaxID=1735272 RepID=UPI001B88E28E|nr:cytochrome P450 20A1-like [Gigantopelta aegis]